ATAWALTPSTCWRSRSSFPNATVSRCVRTTRTTRRSSLRHAPWPPTSPASAPSEMTAPTLLRDLGLLLLMVAWVVAAHVGSTGWGNADFNAAVGVLPIAVALLMALWRLPQW